MSATPLLQPRTPTRARLTRLALAAALGLGAVAPVWASPFEIAVSPTRITTAGNAAARIGQSLKVYNLGNQTTALSFRTIDWTLSEAGELKFHDELLPGSCRPWVSLERRTRQVAGDSDASFRFQIDIPAGTPRGECRFMIAIEGIEPAQQALINSGGASLNLPVSGRIAVAVYVAIGGAQPRLELQQVGTSSLRQDRQPVVRVSNTGDAHGRLEGSLEAVAGDGKRLELTPDGGPILPGQTRTLVLTPRVAAAAAAAADAAAPTLVYPLNVEGTLDWDEGAFKIKASLP